MDKKAYYEELDELEQEYKKHVATPTSSDR
jgi:hypothetical protein